MNDFLSWTGWSGVSAIAQILALATFGTAAWRFVLQRHQAPLFRLDWTILGHRDVGDRRLHVIEFRNVGRGSGQIHMLELFGAKVIFDEKFRAPRLVGSGETFTLQFAAPRLDDAWMRLCSSTLDNSRRVEVAWYPLTSGTMRERWKADGKAQSWFKRARQYFWPTPVEPGGALRGVFRGQRSRPLSALLGDASARADVYSLGTHYNFRPDDLPYHP